MNQPHRRLFAFALVMCLLFGLLPGKTRAEETKTMPVADAPAAETPLDAVPATQTPTELTEAETVSLSKNQVRVIKGQTTTLTAEIPEAQRGQSPLTTASGIVWTSSNPAVATVDSSGVVTGVELGEATITATLNGSVIETYAVYSTLATGYYVLEPYSTLLTLSASSISMEDGTGIEFLSYEYEEESLQTIIGDVWYIKNIVGTTYYSIHPAFSRGMAIALPNSNTVALFKTTNLTAHKWHWQIESAGGGYIFKNRYYTNTTFAAVEEDENYYIETATINTASHSQRWGYFSPILVPGMLLFDLLTGELLSADFGYSDLDYDSGNASATIQKGTPCTLEEISLSVQFVEAAESYVYTMSFSPSYASINMASYEITGTQVGTTTATISKLLNGDLKQLSFELSIRFTKQIAVYNYFDSSFTTTQLNYIVDAINFVNTAFTYDGYNTTYLAAYDRQYVSAGPYRSYTAFDSCYTECEHSDNCYSDPYECGLDCNEHHKNIRRISHVLNLMNRDNTLQVLWSDKPERYFCGQTSSVHPDHIPYSYIAAVCRDQVNGTYIPRQVVHFMRNPATTSNEVVAAMAITLAHEVAHTLGLEEAYLDSNHDVEGWHCVMERYNSSGAQRFYTYILNNAESAFCPDCIANLTDVLT